MATKLTAAADLRVGNYVNWGDTLGTITQITYDGWIGLKYDTDKYRVLHVDMVNPIPLTEEWLVKLGCKMRLALFYPFNGGANNIILNYVNDSYYPILTQEPEMSCDECQMVSLNKIEFVHEFQNLIYALTNTELTIKEDKQ